MPRATSRRAVQRRPGPRRQQLDEPHDVGAGQPRGLRRLGVGGVRRMGLRQRPALLPQGRTVRGRGQQVPRRRGAAAGRADARAAPDDGRCSSARPSRPAIRPWTTTTPRSSCGVAISQVNQLRGLRHSAADAFLSPARGRANLTVRPPPSPAASCWRARARSASSTAARMGPGSRGPRGEVVLSAGALASPKLLMLSGIGPRDVLARHGIAVAADSPASAGTCRSIRPRRWSSR